MRTPFTVLMSLLSALLPLAAETAVGLIEPAGPYSRLHLRLTDAGTEDQLDIHLHVAGQQVSGFGWATVPGSPVCHEARAELAFDDGGLQGTIRVVRYTDGWARLRHVSTRQIDVPVDLPESAFGVPRACRVVVDDVEKNFPFGAELSGEPTEAQLTVWRLDEAACQALNPVREEARWGWRGQQAIPDEHGVPLVDDLSAGKLVWRSQTYVADSAQEASIEEQVGVASPILADGRLYQFMVVGNEREILPDLHAKFAERWVTYAPGVLRRMASRTANDVLACIDAETGQELWRQVLPGEVPYLHDRGVRHNLRVHLTPAYGDGRVFVYGAAGDCYALDAASGELLWRVHDATIVEAGDAKPGQKEKWLRKQEHLRNNQSMVGYAAGTMIVNIAGFYGLDAATGAYRWGPIEGGHEYTSLRSWRHGGRELAITASGTCFQPEDGRILWQLPLDWRHDVAVQGNVLVDPGGEDRGMSAWDLSLEGGTMRWQLPADRYGPAKYQFPLIDGEHVYQIVAQAGAKNRGEKDNRLVCIALEDGDIRWEKPVARGYEKYYSIVRAGGYGLVHCNERYHWLPTDPSASVEDEGVFWYLRTAHSVTPILTEGRLWLRGEEGISCYDLRAR